VFSQDTIRFDTIITGQGSTTRSLVVFNHGEAGLRNVSVRLKNGSQSLFRVNVDGQYLYDGQGDDFQVQRRDSMVVRVEVSLPAYGDEQIRHYEDQLLFTLESGLTQGICLEADGMDVRILRGKVIETDDTLTAGMPYQIFDSLVVAPGATLTLEPGTRLLFHDKTSLLVHGSLKALGTQEQPITLKSDGVEKMFTNLTYDDTPNRWGGVHLYADSHDNVLEQCDIHSGSYGIQCDSLPSLALENPFLTLHHCVLHNIAGNALTLHSTVARVTGTQISNALARCVEIRGGDVLMAQCTVAQFYPFSADRQEALYLINVDEAEQPVPLLKAHFLNCVITGYADDEVFGRLSDDEKEPANYLFDHCLLRTAPSEDTLRFKSIVYDNQDLEPVNYYQHFATFDTKNLIYDFAPVDSSAIALAGSPEYAELYCPIDRRGRALRREDGKVPCGAYAVAPKKEE